MNTDDLKERTKTFAIRVLKLVDALETRVIPAKRISSLMQEAEGLLKITVASITTARAK